MFSVGTCLRIDVFSGTLAIFECICLLVRDGDRFVNIFTMPKHVLSGCTFEFLYMIRSLQRFVSVGRGAASLRTASVGRGAARLAIFKCIGFAACDGERCLGTVVVM